MQLYSLFPLCFAQQLKEAEVEDKDERQFR